MALEVGLAGLGDPKELIHSLLPYQLVSYYVVLINKKYLSWYNQLPPKEQLNHPPVMVERILTKEETKLYEVQKVRQVNKKV